MDRGLGRAAPVSLVRICLPQGVGSPRCVFCLMPFWACLVDFRLINRCSTLQLCARDGCSRCVAFIEFLRCHNTLTSAEICGLQTLSALATSNNGCQDGSVSLDDEPNENNQPEDNDTQRPTASDSSRSAQPATQNDPDRSSVSDESPPQSPTPETSTRRRGLDFNRNGLWVLGLFDNRIGHLIYAHLNARTRSTDFTLFSGLREKYYRACWWHRFSRLRQVSAIRVARVGVYLSCF